MNTSYKRLREFKLSGIVSNLEERLAFASQNQIGYSEFLELLCEDEVNNRTNNSYKKRLSKAKIPSRKTLEDFDFAFQRLSFDLCKKPKIKYPKKNFLG